MILVTGATGNVGRELVRALVDAGERVRALVRRQADQSRLPAGVEVVVGDLDRPETLVVTSPPRRWKRERPCNLAMLWPTLTEEASRGGEAGPCL